MQEDNKPTGDKRLSWQDAFKLELNQWMKRMVAFRQINIPDNYRGPFLIFEAPELEEFIKSKVIPPERAQAKREVIERVRRFMIRSDTYDLSVLVDELEEEADGE